MRKKALKTDGTRCELSGTRAKRRQPVYFIQGRATVFAWTFINGYETINLELGFVMFLKKRFVYDYGILWNALGMSQNGIYTRLRTILHFCKGRLTNVQGYMALIL